MFTSLLYKFDFVFKSPQKVDIKLEIISIGKLLTPSCKLSFDMFHRPKYTFKGKRLNYSPSTFPIIVYLVHNRMKFMCSFWEETQKVSYFIQLVHK